MPLFTRFRSRIRIAARKTLLNAFRLFAFNDGYFTGLNTFNVIGYIHTNNGSAADSPDVQIAHPTFLCGTSELADFPAVAEMAEPAKSTLIARSKDFDFMIALLMVCHPLSRGSVTLNTTSMDDKPNIDLNILDVDEDMETLVRACKVQASITESNAYKKYGGELQRLPQPACDGYEYKSDAYWRCYVRAFAAANNHLASTCKMGADTDPDAVVDDRLRVHGIHKLRVVDASVIPLLPGANINAAVVMVAEKGAHLIRNDWRRNGSKFY